MGVLYRARDTRLGRTVAIKLLRPETVADPERARRFLQEARAASALNHPNIVTVHDIGDDGGRGTWIAMECLDGESLRQRLARGPARRAGGGEDRRRRGARPRRRARRGHRASRREARERDDHRERDRQGARLRPRQARRVSEGGQRLRRADAERAGRDRRRRHRRDAGLHVSRAGRGPRRRRALRRLLVRRDALRDADGEAALRGRHRAVAALLHPEGRASAGPKPAPGSRCAARGDRRALPREGPGRPLSLGPGAAARARVLSRARLRPARGRLAAEARLARARWACWSRRSRPSARGPGSERARDRWARREALPEIQRLIEADEVTPGFPPRGASPRPSWRATRATRRCGSTSRWAFALR